MNLPLTNAQAKTVIDAEQLYAGFRDAQAKYAEYQGGMHWKKIAGNEYLYRTEDRKGNGKSLGARSPSTEDIYSAFTHRKAELKERLSALTQRLDTQRKVNAAYRVGHVPNEVADVCIQLDKLNMKGPNIMVIGTNAMHAYAAMAGVRFSEDIMATSDVDLLWSHKSKLSLAASTAMQMDGLIGMLKLADKSYEIKGDQSFRAVSTSGFMVDLIRQTPTPPWRVEPDTFFESDLVAVDIWNMKWLLGAPRLTQTAIALDGRMFTIAAPDPRAFAMFKLWLSQSHERDAIKKPRDLAQARAVIQLVEDHLPHYKDTWSALKSFPLDVVTQTQDQVIRERDNSVTPEAKHNGQLDSFASRLKALPSLQNKAGAAYTLHQISTKALHDAKNNASAVNWDQVHQEVIEQSVGRNGQSARAVREALYEYSPGALTLEQRNAIVDHVKSISQAATKHEREQSPPEP